MIEQSDDLEPYNWDVEKDGLWLGDQKPSLPDKDFFDELMKRMDEKFKAILRGEDG